MWGYVQIHCAFVLEAQLYYDPNSTYFFTLDYKKCPESSSLNVSQTVKPCQTMSDPLNCVKLKKTCHESEGNPEESHSEPMELLLIALWIRYFVYDSEVQLLCLVDSQVHL